MKKRNWTYRLLYLTWLLPVYFLVMGVYQGAVYSGLRTTFENGSEHQAIVTGFDLKQIAAQTNGYIDIRFMAPDGTTVEERLSLPVQMAQVLMDYETIPVRYSPGSFNDIVLLPTYELQRNMIRVNLAVILFGFIVTLIIAWKSGRFAGRKLSSGQTEIIFERVDRDEPVEPPNDTDNSTGSDGTSERDEETSA